jgi:hypothetical protein
MILNKFPDNAAKLKHAEIALRNTNDKNKKKNRMKQEYTSFPKTRYYIVMKL